MAIARLEMISDIAMGSARDDLGYRDDVFARNGDDLAICFDAVGDRVDPLVAEIVNAG